MPRLVSDLSNLCRFDHWSQEESDLPRDPHGDSVVPPDVTWRRTKRWGRVFYTNHTTETSQSELLLSRVSVPSVSQVRCLVTTHRTGQTVHWCGDRCPLVVALWASLCCHNPRIHYLLLLQMIFVNPLFSCTWSLSGPLVNKKFVNTCRIDDVKWYSCSTRTKRFRLMVWRDRWNVEKRSLLQHPAPKINVFAQQRPGGNS